MTAFRWNAVHVNRLHVRSYVYPYDPLPLNGFRTNGWTFKRHFCTHMHDYEIS